MSVGHRPYSRITTILIRSANDAPMFGSWVRLLTTGATLTALLLFWGCAPSQTRGRVITASSTGSKDLQPSDLLTINSVTILPIGFERGAKTTLGTEEELLHLLTETVAKESEFTIAGSNKVSVLTSGRSNRLTYAGLGTDGVIVTKILRFEEREGSRLGVDRPARVHLELSLVRVSDSKKVWEGSFHHDDKPLSENLFKIRESRGEGWLTARELIAKGFQQIIKDLSAERRAAFSSN